jgi:uncharacterized protein HemX
MEVIAREKPPGEVSGFVDDVSEMPEEEAPRPKPKPKAKSRPAPKSAPQSSGVGIGMVLLFLLLAAAAFATGLSIRHQKETGESLIKAIVNKPDRVEKAAE